MESKDFMSPLVSLEMSNSLLEPMLEAYACEMVLPEVFPTIRRIASLAAGNQTEQLQVYVYGSYFGAESVTGRAFIRTLRAQLPQNMQITNVTPRSPFSFDVSVAMK